MSAVYELTLASPAMALVLAGIGAIVAGACHIQRDVARERHRERREHGICGKGST